MSDKTGFLHVVDEFDEWIESPAGKAACGHIMRINGNDMPELVKRLRSAFMAGMAAQALKTERGDQPPVVCYVPSASDNE